MNDLDTQLLRAHTCGDLRALIDLYQQAANQAEDETAAGFFLTQAYIFALELGSARADTLRAHLIASEREVP